MTVIHPDFSYGIAIHETGNTHATKQDADVLFETMSAIKSAIGTLALEQAANSGHDIEAFTVSIGRDHYSNGSSDLRSLAVFDPNKEQFETPKITLQETLKLSTADSDCIATNVLIDYLGGSDAINELLDRSLGLASLRLVTDRIYFPGVDHEAQPFQVGMTTMNDLVKYYRTIWSHDSSWEPTSSAHDWHQSLHKLVKNARLFGINQVDLPEEIDWYHKTGSGFDTETDTFYGTVLDAGMLHVPGRELFVAAAATYMPYAEVEDGVQVTNFMFTQTNRDALREHGITIADREGVAA